MEAGFYIKPLLIEEHLVPDTAAITKHFFKEFGLSYIGIKTSFDCGVTDAPVILAVC